MEYDIEGYPILEKRQIHAYSLQYYEEQSLDEVRKWLEGGYKNPLVKQQYVDYLQNLLKKLTRIVVSEESEGIFNSDLRKRLDEVNEVLDRVSCS